MKNKMKMPGFNAKKSFFANEINYASSERHEQTQNSLVPQAWQHTACRIGAALTTFQFGPGVGAAYLKLCLALANY
jgi:hypothetical protein